MNNNINQLIEVSGWHPIVFILLAMIVGLVVYLIYRRGNSSFKKTKDKVKPFLSGNKPPKESKALHIGGSNLYWGFTDALKRYFKPLVGVHTGLVNDYLYWFIITLAIVMILVYFV